MDPERWQKLEELFHASLEREPVARAFFIADSCASDPEMRKELESMVEHHDRAGNMIESPAYDLVAETILGEDSLHALIGKSLGQYQIIRVLGRGGLGVVFLAFDEALRRNVAIKFLNDDLASDSSRVQRFKQEAHAASALNHPNILTIFDIGEIDQRQFIVTEFVEGETLRDRLNTGHGDLRQALDICAQIASALTAAHTAGIVHRDIKPENIMLRHDGFIKVLDFGLAKLTSGPTTTPEVSTQVNTGPGVVIGTVQYMSPEQLRGQEVDVRTDIWSLGVVLYEMLAGDAPFKSQTQSDTIAAILKNKPSFTWRTVELPPELEWILKKALAKERDERYQIVKELLIDLRRLARELEADTLQARTTSESVESAIYVQDRVSSTSSLASREIQTTIGGKLESLDSGRAAIPAKKRYRKTINSLAVMPLTNVNADPEAEYLSDGITESIINNLSQLPRLRVMARSTVFRYKGLDFDPQQVGAELGVHAVLTGRVLQVKDSLVISAELVRAADGSQLWGQHFNSQMGDIFSVQEEIARQISERLQTKSSTEENKRLVKRPTQSAEAYQLYLKGRYFWNKRTPEGFQKAIPFFEEATKVDLNYALAYSGLADCSTLLNYYSVIPSKIAMGRAKAAAERALKVDEALSETHASVAMVAFWYDWDWLRAQIEFDTAIRLNPGYASAHEFYGWYLVAMGQHVRSVEEGQLAIDLDPLAPATNLALSKSFFFARRYDEAIKLCRHTLSLDSTFVPARYFLGQAYIQQRRFAEALAEYEKGLNVLGELPFATAVVAHAQALAGNPNAAEALLDKLVTAVKIGKTFIPAFGLAMVHTGLGNKEEAIKWLERAYDERSLWMVYLNVDPVFDSLREEPEFEKLLLKMNFPQAAIASEATGQP